MEDFARKILLPVLIILLIGGLLLFFINLYLLRIRDSMERQGSSAGSTSFQTENTDVWNETPVSEETILWVAP
ncbi:MAG: hypothetical protein PHP22_02080 [Oscillospiraceae bacterium]|jgi:hypothetical protein|nr:hypothetical protein [Oscillospiraceae bacterium]